MVLLKEYIVLTSVQSLENILLNRPNILKDLPKARVKGEHWILDNRPLKYNETCTQYSVECLSLPVGRCEHWDLILTDESR